MSRTLPKNAPLRILIADDESLLRRELNEALCHAGYDVVAAEADGNAALGKARCLKPDLVILDVMLPGLDGIETATILHDERIAPAILLTAHAGSDMVKRAAAAGVYSYLVKPVRTASLISAIEVAQQEWKTKEVLHNRISQLEIIEETRTAVTIAKRILMQYRDINEMEAYRLIQQSSMNSRRSMRAVADAIFTKYQVDCALSAQVIDSMSSQEREAVRG